MTTAFVHVAVGVLVALALRLDWRLVPFAALLAEVPDLDHLGGHGRGPLHTMWFLVLIPALVMLWGLLARWPDRWRRLAAGAPALVVSHLLLDLFPQPSEVTSDRVPLLWPFDGRDYHLADRIGHAAQPPALSSLGIVMFLLALAVCVGYAAPTLCTWLEQNGRRWRWAAWLASAFLPLTTLLCLLAGIIHRA